MTAGMNDVGGGRTRTRSRNNTLTYSGYKHDGIMMTMLFIW